MATAMDTRRMPGAIGKSLARSIAAAIVLLCAVQSQSLAGEPIPPAKRISASVVTTIAAPEDQPMHMPTDVAVDSKARIYVADGANNRILRFSADGKLEEQISEIGENRLDRPVGVTVDAKDQLWIADTGNHAIFVLDSDGKLVTGITPLQIDATGPADPTDIAVTADGKRTYVVDNDHHRILARDNQTRRWTSLGTNGRALGQFQWPFMLCVGAENYVYVTEAIGARVQQISPSDRWAGEIGRWGVELGEFYRPKGIAADAKGRLYVSDSTMGVVQVFSARGVNEGVLTGADGQPLRFKHPMGMCFDRQGRLYVVELTAGRVAVVAMAPPAAATKE